MLESEVVKTASSITARATRDNLFKAISSSVAVQLESDSVCVENVLQVAEDVCVATQYALKEISTIANLG